MTAVADSTEPVRLHFEGVGGIHLTGDRRGHPTGRWAPEGAVGNGAACPCADDGMK